MAQGLQTLRDAVQPCIDKTLLRGSLWLPGRECEVYVDPVAESVVHFHLNDSAAFRWPDTILQDRNSEPYAWIKAHLFPEDFLETAAFEATEILYRAPLETPLLEFVVFGHSRPAPFSQADCCAKMSR